MGYDSVASIAVGQAMTEFVRNAHSHCDVLQMNQVMDDHYSLMAVACNPSKNLSSDFDNDGKMLVPSRDVFNPGLWLTICDNLYGSNIFPRTKCLEDVYYRMLTNKNAASTFLNIPHWQAWILPLALDVPKSKGKSVGKMMVYVIGMMSQLIWTTMETKSFDCFVRELRFTLAGSLAVCADASGDLVHQCLKSMATRFHTDILKWAKLPPQEQVKRYKCLQHFIRLIVALGLNVSCSHFRHYDALKTFRVLRKELREVGSKKKKKNGKIKIEYVSHDEMEEEKSANMRRPNQGFGAYSYQPPTPKSHSTKTTSNGSRPSAGSMDDSRSGARVRSQASGTAGQERVEVANDQDLLYLLKVYRFSMRPDDEDDMKGLASRQQLRSSPYMTRVMPNEEHGDALRLSDMRFVLTASNILGIYRGRMGDMKRSITTYGDSNHVCQYEGGVLEEDIELTSHGKRWHRALPEFIKPLEKIQQALKDLKAQDDKFATKAPVDSKIDKRCKKARVELTKEITFVNDTVGFMELMFDRLWALLNTYQVGKLVYQFLAQPDMVKRRKVFSSWEKEKLKTEAVRLKKREKRIGMKLRGSGAAKLLIGKGAKGRKSPEPEMGSQPKLKQHKSPRHARANAHA
uniref:Uncharacterized protein n=1 Tax=Lotharella globosa TaxID=91324 RepID=A0A7S3ZEH5_9EUKA